MNLNFYSDNVVGVAAPIMQAIVEANEGAMDSYGEDDITRKAQKLIAELFETDCLAHPVATGTVANALALASVTPVYGSILCHEDAHLRGAECGAVEFYTGAGRLHLLAGEDGKFTAETLREALATAGIGNEHLMQPSAVSITQATELGTLYSLEEIRAIADVAHEFGLPLHMDGARFANGIAGLGCSPAEMTWKAGVDLLSFGATKNGAMGAEAVVYFNRDLAKDFLYRRKRGGHLFSKMRFVSAQLCAYVSDDLWLENARHANAAARKLAAGMEAIDGVELVTRPEANIVFLRMPDGLLRALKAAGVGFSGEGKGLTRMVCAFNTEDAAIEKLLELVREKAET